MCHSLTHAATFPFDRVHHVPVLVVDNESFWQCELGKKIRGGRIPSPKNKHLSYSLVNVLVIKFLAGMQEAWRGGTLHREEVGFGRGPPLGHQTLVNILNVIVRDFIGDWFKLEWQQQSHFHTQNTTQRFTKMASFMEKDYDPSWL